ncbi:stamen-specific protein FIL1 [Raphanus sativus]|uniref:Stamen-specific protein FIL1 n=1 Tax=Raphanus sativus TaxID=3726 RepID=A0A6J0MWF9_RAPSA|nr:stamen-specific protein FIL1 [Raphanus sativus]
MAASSSSSKSSLAMLMKVAMLVALVLVATVADGQSCNRHLSGLNVCGEFVVPGADKTNPSAECCNALEAVPSECLCNTLRIASRLPTRCSIPTLSCS